MGEMMRVIPKNAKLRRHCFEKGFITMSLFRCFGNIKCDKSEAAKNLQKELYLCASQPHTVPHVHIPKAGVHTPLGLWAPSLDTPRIISPSSFPLFFSIVSLSSFLLPLFVSHP